MTKPISKTEQIRAAWAAGDKLGALRIASKFGDQSGDTKAMQRGWNAHSDPDFYIQIDKDPKALTDKALAIIERKFIKAKDAEPATVDHSASNKLIADAIARDPELAAKAKAPATKAEKPKPLGKRAAILADAEAGKLPPAPDFSAPTHARFRKKLGEVVAIAEAGDLAALRAFQINPVSSSPKAIARYRDLAVIALEARA